MATRRSAASDTTVEAVEKKAAPSPLPGKTVRSLAVVAEAIRERFAKGEHAETIQQELAVSPHVFRELLSHSYKLVGRAPEIFEYQEKVRVGELAE
jgi:hypothetical protein